MPNDRHDLAARLALKARLPRTWPAFFERHGNFTPAQLAAIPALLDDHNVLLCAPTAGGKTEAAVAPLVERHCPPGRPTPGPRILYLTPTRALASDLAARLAHPLESLGLTLGVKTRDQSTFRPNRPPDLLITTPESADSTLAARAQMFAGLRAIVLDELHLFDGTPRGDQLRAVLSRIRRVRAYAFERGDAPDAHIQYAALSATIEAAIADRYFERPVAFHIPGSRAIAAETLPLAPDGAGELIDHLATFRARGWRKALVFCNSRAEVEAYATAVRTRSPFDDAVYVHYSNIEARRRREIERSFAEAGAAICFASSTLELGIDIGDIDVVILIGPPGSRDSLIQRIGRGNRRGGGMRVICFYRTPLERLLFAALLDDHRPPTNDERRTTTDSENQEPLRQDSGQGRTEPLRTTNYGLRTMDYGHFRPAVAVQQIFSLLKQSRTAAVRLAELASLFAGMLAPDDLQAILGELQQRDYLKVGRPGEWRPGERLNELFDQQTGARPGPSVYSNIQSADVRQIEIRDQHTQQTIARVDALWLSREALTLEGRPVNVEWCDGEALWVAAYQDGGIEHFDPAFFRSARQLLSYALARLLPIQLGLPLDAAPLVGTPDGWYWFHWLGDLYGQAALDLLHYRIPAQESAQPGLCMRLTDEPQAPPAWTEEQVIRYLGDNYRRFESLLALGPFQTLLPLKLRRRAIVEQFDIPRFLGAVAALRPIVAPEAQAEDLMALVNDGQKSRNRR